ncbi:MAG TPA: DNA polymerase III subunit epsilon [Gammaproteobacteria bacterium]|nr:DNA polymerase III subunit epsilon [Gammaproteobacteria bacterium]
MRQIVLDTETTGLEASQGHRVIEIGCVELVNRRVTGNHWHRYINPEREIDPGAFEVHGISNEFLQDKPRFAELAEDFVEYVAGAELVIHNAPFDVEFLERELARLQPAPATLRENCSILDTLVLARQKHPGQKNSLDALCKRYEIDNSGRSLHGALLDARILADVYLVMTGGQASLGFESGQGAENRRGGAEVQRIAAGQPLPLWQVDESARRANLEYIEFLATQHEDPAWK